MCKICIICLVNDRIYSCIQYLNGLMNNTTVTVINERHVQRRIHNYKELRVLLWKPCETEDSLACFYVDSYTAEWIFIELK